MFCLLSAQGTGTHFAMSFLELLGLYGTDKGDPADYYQIHTDHHQWEEWKGREYPVKYPHALIPLRHPYLGFLSRWRVRGMTAEQYANQWELLIHVIPLFDQVVFLPIDTSLRLSTLLRVATFVRCPTDTKEQLFKIKQFAESWTPQNQRAKSNTVDRNKETEFKERYLQDGEMPVDVSALDSAVAWYWQKMEELCPSVKAS